MTDDTERDYKDDVQDFLEDHYGASWVTRNPGPLPSGRRPDFTVQTPLHVLYVAVETDADAAIAGAGQAVEYAGEAQARREEQALPVVVAPDWEYPEADGLRQYVTQVTVPMNYGAGDLEGPALV
jgi:hypothetical protein